MTKEHLPTEETPVKASKKPEETEGEKRRAESSGPDLHGLASLQQRIGNQAVQRLVQRSGEGPAELDEETVGRINRERSGGGPLNSGMSDQMGAAMGRDYSGVRAHTSPESDDLNRQLGAKAFTTGQDIFFREGAYDPHSSDGQELIAHELTHVAQQSSGAVGGSGGKLTVNAPGDAFEQEADAVSKAITRTGPASEVQPRDEAEDGIQMQPAEEEGEELQMQPMEEEEEELQMQVDEEEEEELV